MGPQKRETRLRRVAECVFSHRAESYLVYYGGAGTQQQHVSNLFGELP